MAAKFILSIAGEGKYCYDLIATNGEKVLHSENYPSKTDCFNAIQQVKENAVFLHRFEKKQTDGGQYYFVLHSDQLVVGTSDRYWSVSSRDYAMTIVRREAAGAVVER